MIASDITARYSLPPLQRTPACSHAHKIVSEAKSVRYAEQSAVSYASIMAKEEYSDGLLKEINIRLEGLQNGFDKKDSCFSGTTASELNRFLSEVSGKVYIKSSKLIIDEPVKLGSNQVLIGSNTICEAEASDIAFVGENISNFGLENFELERPGHCGIMLIRCAEGIIANITIADSDGDGILIRGGAYIRVEKCLIMRSAHCGIIVHDGAHHCHFVHCEVAGNRHSSNWAAGIVITMLRSVSRYGMTDAFIPGYFYPVDLSYKLESIPYKIFLESCDVHHNQSSGIYVDGGNGNVITGNNIHDNDKEGVCLDFYAIANIVSGNRIDRNGYRSRQKDSDLEADCVLGFGRLTDGSAAAKLPNVSLDNAAYNLICNNSISRAAGDGIKFVRSCFRNIIGLNSITDNNVGHNARFHFFGILLGSASSEVENDTSGLDRGPSIENIIFGNTICGRHAIGIVYDTGSVYNDTFDNTITNSIYAPFSEHTAPNNMVGNSPDAGGGKLIGFVRKAKKLLMKIRTLLGKNCI